MILGWFRGGKISFSEVLEMPVGRVQELYNIAVIESEKANKENDTSKGMEALEEELTE